MRQWAWSSPGVTCRRPRPVQLPFKSRGSASPRRHFVLPVLWYCTRTTHRRILLLLLIHSNSSARETCLAVVVFLKPQPLRQMPTVPYNLRCPCSSATLLSTSTPPSYLSSVIFSLNLFNYSPSPWSAF